MLELLKQAEDKKKALGGKPNNLYLSKG